MGERDPELRERVDLDSRRKASGDRVLAAPLANSAAASRRWPRTADSAYETVMRRDPGGSPASAR